MRHHVFELRQYTLHPGQREVLISMFDRHFLESQEAVGIRVIGQFRDLDRPDHFVWIRSFEDMVTRDASLRAFYGGPLWKAHREAANATMIDSDDVLLLRPAARGEPFGRLDDTRPGPDADARPASLVLGTVWLLDRPVDGDFPLLRGAGPPGLGRRRRAAPGVPADRGVEEHLPSAPGPQRRARLRLVCHLRWRGGVERLRGRAGALAGVERRGPSPAGGAGARHPAAPPAAHRALAAPLSAGPTGGG